MCTRFIVRVFCGTYCSKSRQQLAVLWFEMACIVIIYIIFTQHDIPIKKLLFCVCVCEVLLQPWVCAARPIWFQACCPRRIARMYAKPVVFPMQHILHNLVAHFPYTHAASWLDWRCEVCLVSTRTAADFAAHKAQQIWCVQWLVRNQPGKVAELMFALDP